MKLSRLYIENFMCHEKSFIDFTQFSAALIVGKVDNNELYSNGVGKTTIFKAIEYVLFNQSDVNLEKIVRDDTNFCKVVIDFTIDNQEYRISRSRTKKGITDLILLQRNTVPGSDAEVYHNSANAPFTKKEDTEKYWKDKSGSRSGDTEKDLAKLIKINPKSFRSTIHFLQNDLTGLPTATPEKRKAILKEALNLAVYTKLEKIAKDKAGALSKEIDKHKTLIETLGTPDKDLLVLASQLAEVEKSLDGKNAELTTTTTELNEFNDKVNALNKAHSDIEGKFSSLLSKEQGLLVDKSRLEVSIKEYTSKKSNVIRAAKELVGEVRLLKEKQTKLAALDYSQIDILTEEVNSKKEKITQHNVNIKNSMEEYEELKIPLPNGSVCKNCRKPMTDKDRKEHNDHAIKEIADCQEAIRKSKAEVAKLNFEITPRLQEINSLNLSKQQLENVNTQIVSKNKEIQDKNIIHDEYTALLEKFNSELECKNEELKGVMEELKNSSIDEAKLIKQQIEEEKAKIVVVNTKIHALNKEITHYNNNKAIVQHGIEQKTKDKLKLEELTTALWKLESKFSIYPSVLQAFSSTGIPNLIIQNVLDDLQVEANSLLSQLKPGLQLSFFVEKTVEKTGDQADTLDIQYQVNGKERYYEQLSGAMKLAITFSLKLGLSFLLQKMIGTDIKFLLLDEIDQSLDKASVDAFADIVKFFQKDFTILVITHNDRLKDKFSHAILVEQDMNMISRARVVSSW